MGNKYSLIGFSRLFFNTRIASSLGTLFLILHTFSKEEITNSDSMVYRALYSNVLLIVLIDKFDTITDWGNQAYSLCKI